MFRSPATQERPMTRTEALTDTQQRALDHMRTHDGVLNSGEGFSITTMRVLANAGLITMTERRAAERTLGRTTVRVFEAHLTDTGWGEHERPAPPAPRPVETYHQGDIVKTLTGMRATVIRTGTDVTDLNHNRRTDGVTIHGLTGYLTLVPEVLTLVERAADRPEPQEPTEAPAAPQEGVYSAAGVYYRPGIRVTFRTVDGWWMHGTVTAVDPAARTVTLDADLKQIAPMKRPMYKGQPLRPGRMQPGEGTWIRSADDKNLTLTKEQ
jgi:hypothetical protein